MTHVLCSSGQTSSPMNLGPPEPGEPSQVSASKRHRQGSGGIKAEEAEKACCGRAVRKNAAVGGEGAVAGGAGGLVDDAPLLQEPCRGQTFGQASLPEDGSG